jgi:putative protein kinase ArgK-like GTPase of G3E family
MLIPLRQTMSNYLKSAIAAIYGEDDDFILLGLTGRTGSGCSTVANILQAEMCEIKAMFALVVEFELIFYPWS